MGKPTKDGFYWWWRTARTIDWRPAHVRIASNGIALSNHGSYDMPFEPLVGEWGDQIAAPGKDGRYE